MCFVNALLWYNAIYNCLFTQQVYHYYTIKLAHSQVWDVICHLGSDSSKLCGASTMVWQTAFPSFLGALRTPIPFNLKQSNSHSNPSRKDACFMVDHRIQRKGVGHQCHKISRTSLHMLTAGIKSPCLRKKCAFLFFIVTTLTNFHQFL